MPTYEYECKSCGHVFDLFQSIKAAPLRKHECAKCRKVRAVRRLLGAGGALIFKGSGFYTTDYRGEGYKKAAKAEADAGKPATDPSKSGDGAKTPAKTEPAAKPDTPRKSGKKPDKKD